MQTRAVFLHDVACDDVLEGLVELGQVVETVLHHVRSPLIDLRLLISVAPDRVLDRILDDRADLCGVLLKDS